MLTVCSVLRIVCCSLFLVDCLLLVVLSLLIVAVCLLLFGGVRCSLFVFVLFSVGRCSLVVV